MTPEAERFNGWSAMIGFVAAIGAYALQQVKLYQVFSNERSRKRKVSC